MLYVAPWVDYGGTDKGTIDWFKWLDRDRFRASLVTTQPSSNARLREVLPYAEEVWPLPQLMHGDAFARFLCDFIFSRGIRVMHVMNSRLGFDLLPFLAALPWRPAVVVQLHVEEDDRSGYVRYVSTRYGNLVDAFSLTSEHLAEAVEGYEVPRAKCRVIRTGVDALGEFDPSHVRPVDGLEVGVAHVLFVGRLVPQKDPLLMVEVATALRERLGEGFRIHVVGDGPLEPEVREALAARGLERQFVLHGPSAEVARWYAACDVLLMTSAFEGIPYVLYEAMAMGVPAVVPALRGNVELLEEGGGVLVSPRADAAQYADALADLVGDAGKRAALGAAGRRVALERHSLTEMARAHERLYAELLARRPAVPRPSPAWTGYVRDPIRCARRPGTGQPLVSVIVPCFDHGRYLDECVESIAGQSYGALQTIVVDDASSDPETLAAIERLADDPRVEVVRLPVNSGPSAARNAGIARARGRYVFPVDADNVLLPDAVERLVAQLQAAGEQVGFIYPNHQYFGNRSDFFEAPEYNLHALLHGNYCDTSALIDRDLFDAGVEYGEDLLLGHEDWDFVLQLAERGVRGEPARAKTLLSRKVGFTRSELIEHRPELPRDQMTARHPGLYTREDEIKAHWSPGLSLLALAPEPSDEAVAGLLVKRLRGQTCRDAELVLHSTRDASDRGGLPIRTLPARLAEGPAAALAGAVAVARGRYRLATLGAALDLLADPALVEKVLRVFHTNPGLSAIAFHDAGARPSHPFELIADAGGGALEAHALAWSASLEDDLPDQVALPGNAPLRGLADELERVGSVQWRHLSRPHPGSSRPHRDAVLVTGRPQRASEAAELEHRRTVWPRLPKMPDARATWPLMHPWRPPGSQPLCRHRREDGGAWIVTNERTPPRGYELEYDLGSIPAFSFPGTLPLYAHEHGFEVGERDGDRKGATLLGHLEQAAFPLLDPLLTGVERRTGRTVLVAGEADPLRGAIDHERVLGWIESYPVHPREPPHAELGSSLVGLVRSIDLRARRHRYGVGELPAGELVVELGALRPAPAADAVPVWVTRDGLVCTESYRPIATRPILTGALRWLLAPASWRGFSTATARSRAVMRRGVQATAALAGRVRPAPEPEGAPHAYLAREPRPRWSPLYSAVHPVTGDQLLTRDRYEAIRMGYGEPVLLGHMAAAAPLTGRLEPVRAGVPWASRFGLAA